MKIMKIAAQIAFFAAAFLALAYAVFAGVTQPRTDRDWTLDQMVEPKISIDGNKVSIKNMRNFSYRAEYDYIPGYYDKTFDLDQIKSVDYIVEPFAKDAGAAHTFLTFGFEDGSYVAISVEIRKEKGEEFSPVKGLFRQYELSYVIGDERDLIKLRTKYRDDQVFLYPIKADKERIQALFLDMLARADKLQREPEFYNTITSSCTTNILDHVNKLAAEDVSYDYRILLPGYSDRYAYELGLIDTDLSFEEARAKFNINARAEKYADSPDFSRRIRE